MKYNEKITIDLSKYLTSLFLRLNILIITIKYIGIVIGKIKQRSEAIVAQIIASIGKRII